MLVKQGLGGGDQIASVATSFVETRLGQDDRPLGKRDKAGLMRHLQNQKSRRHSLNVAQPYIEKRAYVEICRIGSRRRRTDGSASRNLTAGTPRNDQAIDAASHIIFA